MNSKLFAFLLVLAAIVATPLNQAFAGVQKIVLDAGHGGKDYGAFTPDGRREKDITLEMTLQLRDRLRDDGFEVILTRSTDIFVPLPLRSDIANKKRADLFVSLHANASTSTSLRGFEVYYLADDVSNKDLALERAAQSSFSSETAHFFGESAAVKQIVWELRSAAERAQSKEGAHRIADSVDHHCDIWTKRLRPAMFQVLRRSECPSVLVEVGYLTNPDDRALLESDAYKKTMIVAIAEGIGRFKQDFETTGGFAP